ncbi:helix-turn-helix domain-containing protein [Candidatus Omnitrophota bacterium]
MESIGNELRQTRESKGITYEEVYAQTKIHSSVIKALEEDRFHDLEPIYIKGFLKIYTRFLGLNTEEFVKAYQKAISPEKEKQSTAKKEKKEKKQAKDNKETKEETSETEKQEKQEMVKKTSFRLSPQMIRNLQRVVVLFVILFLSITIVRCIGRAIRNRPKKITKAVSAPTAAAKKVAAPAKQAPKTPAKPAETPKPPAPEPEPVVPEPEKERFPVKISIQAKQDCMLKIRVDGKLIYGDIFRKGMSDSWQAKEKIELYVGNAGGIELEYNGRLLPSLGRRREVIKSIVFTKDGFVINK